MTDTANPAAGNADQVPAHAPADYGRAGAFWTLAHAIVTDDGATYQEIGVYADPRAAVHDVAERIRPTWRRVAGAFVVGYFRQVPPVPPADDFAAVALFFADHGRPGVGDFSLAPVHVDQMRAPATSAAVDDPEYVLTYPGGEWLCLCGNTASLDLFSPCTRDGRRLNDYCGNPWSLCERCGRVIADPTGIVVGRIDLTTDPR